MPSMPYFAGEITNYGIAMAEISTSSASMPSSSGGPVMGPHVAVMGQPPKHMPKQSPLPKSAAEPPDMLQLHLAGKCYPCVAYALKPAGCFKGEACMHCHYCNAKEAKARRRELQQAARRRKRMENALSKEHGEPEIPEPQQSPQQVSEPSQDPRAVELPPDVQPTCGDVQQSFSSVGKQSFWL